MYQDTHLDQAGGEGGVGGAPQILPDNHCCSTAPKLASRRETHTKGKFGISTPADGLPGWEGLLIGAFLRPPHPSWILDL